MERLYNDRNFAKLLLANNVAHAFNPSGMAGPVSSATSLARTRNAPRMAVSPAEARALLQESWALFNRRMATSAEVAVSKIFPAGAGWQLASAVADGCGFATTSLPFFCLVGLGDLSGVALGHVTYQFLKKKLFGATSISIGAEVQTAALFGGAAFFSGACWQIALNAFNTLGFTFTQALAGVSLSSTVAFFAGLRIMRRLLSPSMPAVEGITYDNQESDLALAAAVGVGCGFFVGTDVSFGSANWLAWVVGIQEHFSIARAAVAAGLSTSIGFIVNMLWQSASLPKKTCWIDPDFENPRTAVAAA